ncbi:MAG: class F sortase [Gaiella sp.]
MRALSITFAVLVVAVTGALTSPGTLRAAEPPNQNDPCSTNGRNACETTGVGSYRNYQYGIRWFGDYRGAVPNEAHTFCIDLRFWYPSAKYNYKLVEATGLKNRAGAAVPLERLRRMAYAMHHYGRSRNVDQQAAVMLYVHTLMADGAPGEVGPSVIGSTVAGIYQRIENEAARLHGPYRLDIQMPGRIAVGAQGTATIRLLAASGAAVPNVGLELSANGARGVPGKVSTGPSGVVRVALTADDADGVRLSVQTEALASTLPKIYAPTTAAAARNGQRLAAPDTQRISAAAGSTGARAKITVSTTAKPSVLLVGEQSRDEVKIDGARAGYNGTVEVEVHGPFRAIDQIRCDRTPAFTTTFRASGSGTTTTAAFRPTAPGYYQYRVAVPADDDHTGITAPCQVESERIKVEVQPVVKTVVSAPTVAPGTAIHDKVTVSGTAGEKLTIIAELFGPFGAPDTINCDTNPVWTGTLQVDRDGEYLTDEFTVTTPGFYSYRESIAASEFVREVKTPCGEASETTVVTARPQIRTQVSDSQITVGSKLTDKAVVTGLGALTVTVRVELWGPFATRAAIRCTGTPYWTGTFPANGDGTYTTQAVTIEHVGYYTYREAIEASPANTAVETECGEAAETSFARSEPKVTTLVSDAVVRPGSMLFDRIRVSGLGKTSARIEVELWGPFATKDAISCSGKPFWEGEVTAKGDGELRSPAVRVQKVGFYTYRERLLGQPLVQETRTACGEPAETSLVAPAINTGRSANLHSRTRQQAGAAPARVRIASLAIDAPVSSVGISIAKSELAVPSDIRRLGWWRDGAAPGDKNGSLLIAGHVDSARDGAGAFVNLKNARPGQRIEVRTGSGKVVAYKVQSVRTMPKPQLPTSVYEQSGPHRLVLVTCGGPFVQARGSYRDNVVVTAIPA